MEGIRSEVARSDLCSKVLLTQKQCQIEAFSLSIEKINTVGLMYQIHKRLLPTGYLN